MHILICLSYFHKSPVIAKYVEECKFTDKISGFVEEFSKEGKRPNDENTDIDRRTILDLCAHIFHPSQQEETGFENEEFIMSYEVGEFNDMRVEDRIKEFENEQGDLIFECFVEESSLFSLSGK